MRHDCRSRFDPQEDCPPDDICYLCDAPLKQPPFAGHEPDEHGFCSYACWFTEDPTYGCCGPNQHTSAFPDDSLVWYGARKVSSKLLAAADEEGLLPVMDWHDLIAADRRFREVAPDNYDPKRTNTHPIQTKHRKVVSRMLLGRWRRAARKSIRRDALDKAILHYRTTVKKAGLGELPRHDAIADLRVKL
jgi:hypothetical protein